MKRIKFVKYDISLQQRERERGGGGRERGDKMKTDIRSEIETDKEG